MSNITGFKFNNQPGSFPGSPLPASHSLKDPIMQEWISLENGGQVNGKTVRQLVETAIKDQVKKSQNADSVLNSFTFGPQNQIGYTGTFVPPPANLQTPGAAGKVDIRLTVPGNNLAFTVMKQSNPTFEVAFELVVTVGLTFPVALNSTNWAVGISVVAEVEVTQVTTHNVGVYLCDKNAVNDVLKAINHQTISVPNVASTAFVQLNQLIQLLAGSGETTLMQSDDGAGNIVLFAIEPHLFVSGGNNDTIVVNTNASGQITVSAQGQTGTIVGTIWDITVTPGSGNNTVKIVGAPDGTKVIVQNTNHGNNTVIIGGGGMAKLKNAPITVSDTTGATALVVDDTGDKTGRIATVTKDTVDFVGLTSVGYSGNVTTLKVIGGTGPDQLMISSLNAGTSATLDAGTGINSVYVGVFGQDPTTVGKGDGSVKQIYGPLDVINPTGETNLIIDCDDDGYQHFEVDSDHVSFPFGATINYAPATSQITHIGNKVFDLRQGVISLTIYGSPAGNNAQVNSVGSVTPVTIWGASGDIIGGAAASGVTHDIYAPAKPTGPIHKVQGA